MSNEFELKNNPDTRRVANAVLNRLVTILDFTSIRLDEVRFYDGELPNGDNGDSVTLFGTASIYQGCGVYEDESRTINIPHSVLLDDSVDIADWLIEQKNAAERAARQEKERKAEAERIAKARLAEEAAARQEKDDRETYERLHARFGPA